LPGLDKISMSHISDNKATYPDQKMTFNPERGSGVYPEVVYTLERATGSRALLSSEV